MPAGGGGQANLGHIASQLQQFATTLHQANHQAGVGWRLQQQRNHADQQGLNLGSGGLLGIANYRLHAAFAGAAVAGVGMIGGGVSDAMRHGTGEAGFRQSVTTSALNFMSSYTDVGGNFSQAMQPRNLALQSVADFSTKMARMGGKIDPGMRQNLFDVRLAEERRVYDEMEALGKFGDEYATPKALMSSPRAMSTLNSTASAMDTIGNWMRTAHKFWAPNFQTGL